MYNKIIYLFSFLIPLISFSQEVPEEVFDGPSPKQEFALVAYAGFGLSHYYSEPGSPAFTDASVKLSNPIGTLRILWHPDHRLRVGIESGFTTFYSYELTGNGNRGLLEYSAIPLLLEFSMTIYKNFHVYGGAGTYLLRSHLNFLGEVDSKFFSNGWMLGAAYVYPVTDRVGVAAEAKWLNAAETRDATIAGQVQLVWKFYKW